jgi:hypothetical protein
MQTYPISEPMGRTQAEDKVRLTWCNSDLECSVGRWFMAQSLDEKKDSEMSGYVFDDSLLLVSFVDEKGTGGS